MISREVFEALHADEHYRLICYLSGVAIPDKYLPLNVEKVASCIYGEQWRVRLRALSDKIREHSNEQLRQHLLETENIFMAFYDPVVDDWWAVTSPLQMVAAIAAQDPPSRHQTRTQTSR